MFHPVIERSKPMPPQSMQEEQSSSRFFGGDQMVLSFRVQWCPSLHLHTNRSSEASHLQLTWLKSEEQPICFFKFLHKKKRAIICGSGTKAAHLYFPAEDRTQTCEITTQQPQKRQNSWLANAINHLNEIWKPKLSLDKLPVVLSFLIAASINTYPLDASAFVTAPQKKLQSDELATVRLLKENSPSVVYITNLASRRDVFTLDVMEVPQGSRSGFVWDKGGHIITNFHVIRGASDLRIFRCRNANLGNMLTYKDCEKIVCWDSVQPVL